MVSIDCHATLAMTRELIKTIKIKKPANINFIFGQSHFIKTVEDIYEALVSTVPGIKFGLSFCEASGPCLIRIEGTDKKMVKLAKENAMEVGAGHSFFIFLKNCFPINVLPAIKKLPEVCQIFCATANPTDVIVLETKQGRAVLGAVDGSSPKGSEKEKDKKQRKFFLRTIGYKL